MYFKFNRTSAVQNANYSYTYLFVYLYKSVRVFLYKIKHGVIRINSVSLAEDNV